MGGKNEFFENFERNKYLKKLPSMQRDNYVTGAVYKIKTSISSTVKII